MSFISVFDVMWTKNMILALSSSHTAGAARIGFLAQKMIHGCPLEKRLISHCMVLFPGLIKGHGTDRATSRRHHGIFHRRYAYPKFLRDCR